LVAVSGYHLVVPIGVVPLAAFAAAILPDERSTPGACPARRLAADEAAFAAPSDEIVPC